MELESDKGSSQTNDLIEPKLLKGFRDFLPAQEIPRRAILKQLELVMRNFGYVPIDTPVLEYSSVLLGKGGGETDKQVYNFQDHGNRDVAMRFDLTVPFARFMAAHHQELSLPFKRFHFAKVYRGENTQKGRYREFMQCDFDSVGVDSAAADGEILFMMASAFTAIGVPDITIHLSHRGIFNRFLHSMGLLEKSVPILRAVDKMKKIGPEQTLNLLKENTDQNQAQEILDFIQISEKFRGNAGDLGKTNRIILSEIEQKAGGQAEDIVRLSQIFDILDGLGISHNFYLDTSITRGLDYYTGIVYETFLNKLPQIGSVCSGGRYNNLASLYTKEELPGVGSSIGLDRLMAALEELGQFTQPDPVTQVLIFNLDDGLIPRYFQIAQALIQQGISAQVYPQTKKLGAQFSYAEKLNIPVGIIMGPEEARLNQVQIKQLLTRETKNAVKIEFLVSEIRAMLFRGEKPKTNG
jgi:histidyl-tRNA synthetase